MKCSRCPRACNVDRTVGSGFCGATTDLEVAAVVVHRGEEPPLNPIVNLFFAHCNLQCIYCQNWQISGLHDTGGTACQPDELVDRIASLLPSAENILGFVTPTHYANSIPAIVEALHQRDLHPVTVYNTSGYENVETLRMLEPYIDVYLPDFKYSDPGLAGRYSHAPDYPERAFEALREMYRQKGSSLITDQDGLAVSGIIVRHLVLPGCVDNSLKVLDTVADLSINLHVSLMAQYYPPFPGLPDQLGRTLSADEYDTVVAHLHATGLHNGWLQPIEANRSYRPDFNDAQKPFEK